MNRLTISLLTVFIVILMGCCFLAYMFRGDATLSREHAVATSSPSGSPKPGASPEARANEERHPLLWDLFGPDASGLAPSSYANWESAASRIALRFALAAFLAALLAYRPRRGVSFS